LKPRRRSAPDLLAPLPILTEQGIHWEARGDHLRLRVAVTNPYGEATLPTRLVLESALLGAFTPWESVGFFMLAPLEPRTSRHLAFDLEPQTLPSLARDVDYRAALNTLVGASSASLPVAMPAWAGGFRVWFDHDPDGAIEVQRARGVKLKALTTSVIAVQLASEAGRCESRITLTNSAFRAEPLTYCEQSNVTLLLVTAPDAGQRSFIDLNVTRASDRRAARVELTVESV
jgi:hypothetical protein